MRIDFSDIYQKVKLYHSVGRFEAAEKLLQSGLDEFGSLPNLHNLLGVTYHKQSKFADAITQFTKALRVNPSFVESGLNLAVTFCDLGRYDEAKTVFAEILAHTPPNRQQPDMILGRLANQHAQCGALYEQSGLINEAISEYKKALLLFDRMPDVRLAVGKLYFRSGHGERALNEFQELTRSFPDESDGHLWLGICYWKEGRYDQARKQWETARNLGGDVHVASSYLKLAKENQNSERVSAS